MCAMFCVYIQCHPINKRIDFNTKHLEKQNDQPKIEIRMAIPNNLYGSDKFWNS